jgi:REP element-mobilizing transposase RayT
VDKHLDAGLGTCHLRDPALAVIVAGAIQFFAGQRYELRAWVVMPNHVHAVVWPKPPHTLSTILHSWKSYSAHEINHRLLAPVVPFWQGESYDHLIRDEDDLRRCCHYTLMNPVNAGLCARMEDWQWSSAQVAQPSPAAGSGTVPVRVSGTGGETPPQPAGGDACATTCA